MTEHPIIFSGDMVRAILSGQKTQTRRVIKPLLPIDVAWNEHDKLFGIKGSSLGLIRSCPYGEKGHVLWVRENFTYWEQPDQDTQPKCGESVEEWRNRVTSIGKDYIKYLADDTLRPFPNDPEHPCMEHCIGKFGKTIPSIHMPRWASRITLEVLSVRVERVQDISVEDVYAEGVTMPDMGPGEYDRVDDPVAVFAVLWDSINAIRGYAWSLNCWVWVVDFKVKEVKK